MSSSQSVGDELWAERGTANADEQEVAKFSRRRGNVAGVHIIGRRRWNRRGAMVTDRYLQVHHQPSVQDFATWLQTAGYVAIGVDNLSGAVPLESYELPERVCIVFGSEGPGLTAELVSACHAVVGITQYGSTRSLNAGAAAAIAMYHWALRWARPPG